ncbi:Aspartic peptidase domain superfamily [Arabidopsis suecica]|uniref:Aspartic peptidase domain superfamily n=1 Tax=Arabidopsis suecica TaxID=45249 RepID=A0A8T2BP23_ARASU|nr:Aspartic peptidase domain superfamily [Arabidopsis suecica]
MAPTTEAAHDVKFPMAELAERIDNLSTTVAEHTRQFVEQGRRHKEEMREQESTNLELHQAITTRSEPTPKKNPEIFLGNSVEHLVVTSTPEALCSCRDSRVPLARQIRKEHRIPVSRRYHKVRKQKLWKIDARFEMNVDPRLNNIRIARKRRHPCSRVSGFQPEDPLYPSKFAGTLRGEMGRDTVGHNQFTRDARVLAADDLALQQDELRGENPSYGFDVLRGLDCESKGMTPHNDNEVRVSRYSYEDLKAWINSFETYLCESNTPQNEWMKIVYSNLEGETGHWIKSLWERNSPTSWKEFKWMIREEAKVPTRRQGELSRALYSGMLQENSVLNYCREFEAKRRVSMSIPEKYVLEVFLQGLKQPLQSEVIRLQPKGLKEAMDVAKWLEEMSGYMRNETSLQGAPNKGIWQGTCFSFYCCTLEPGAITQLNQRRPTTLGYMGDNEKLMSLTLVHGKMYDSRKELEGVKGDLRTSRLNKGNELKFHGTISGQKVNVLVDSRATNNFISERLATQFQLPVLDSRIVKVTLGYGLYSNVKGWCQDITLQVKDVQIVENYDVLDLKQNDVDVILGYEWLSKLGETAVNWQDHTFSFIHNHTWVTFCAKDKDLKQCTTKVKMRQNNGQERIEEEYNDDGVTFVDYYLEDKVALKGESKGMLGGIANEIQGKYNGSGESQKVRISTRYPKKTPKIISVKKFGNRGGLKEKQGSLGVFSMGYKVIGEKQEELFTNTSRLGPGKVAKENDEENALLLQNDVKQTEVVDGIIQNMPTEAEKCQTVLVLDFKDKKVLERHVEEIGDKWEIATKGWRQCELILKEFEASIIVKGKAAGVRSTEATTLFQGIHFLPP